MEHLAELSTELTTELESLPLFALEIGGNSVFRWILAVALCIGIYLFARISRSLLVKIVSRMSSSGKSRSVDSLDLATNQSNFNQCFLPVVESVHRTVLGIVAFCLALQSLNLPGKLSTVLAALLVATILFQIGISGSRFVECVLNRMMPRDDDDPAKSSAVGLLLFIGRVLLWGVILIVFLDNLGIDITTLIAGLGIGGIAVALAVQNVLGDLLGSLSIILDKPFRVGDFIVVGEVVGSVERIGIKSTRIKSLSGEQLIVSNSDLLSSRIRNFKRMYERRVVLSIGVTYQTPPEKLKKIGPKIKATIEAMDDVRFDRAHFKEFGDFALIFEIVFYVIGADFNLYMDRQESLNLALLEYFTEQGIEFAYPTQTLFIGQSEATDVPEFAKNREVRPSE